jgi:hypothetical protein
MDSEYDGISMMTPKPNPNGMQPELSERIFPGSQKEAMHSEDESANLLYDELTRGYFFSFFFPLCF